MSNATMYLFCGKMGSGKSTFAKRISEQRSVILISEDVLLGTLYPEQIFDVSTYVQFSEKLKSAMAPILVDLLHGGTSVVLDFPANTVNQRKWMKEIALRADALTEFHYLNTSDAICKAQLKKRATNQPGRRSTDTEEMFDSISRYFEPPLHDEGFETIHHERF